MASKGTVPELDGALAKNEFDPTSSPTLDDKISEVNWKSDPDRKSPLRRLISDRSNVFKMHAPSMFDSGLPTLVPIPTNVPAYPSSMTLSWMQKRLPEDVQIDYYELLLEVIAEMRDDIRVILMGNRTAADRVKRCITQCRLFINQLIHEMLERERQEEKEKTQKALTTRDSQAEENQENQENKENSNVLNCMECCCNNRKDNPFHELANKEMKHDPDHPTFQPLTVDCPDYPAIALNKRTGRPVYVCSGPLDDKNLVPMDNKGEPLLIKAPHH